jgi:hypothetical protein
MAVEMNPRKEWDSALAAGKLCNELFTAKIEIAINPVFVKHVEVRTV